MEKSENIVINIKGLQKSFDDHHVLKGVDMEVKKGENLVILGKSGEGKSVLIKCLVRLIDPDRGKIEVLGEDVCTTEDEEILENLRSQVGFLFQGAALYDSMSVGDNLLFPLKRSGAHLSPAEMRDKVEEALENVGLEETIDKMPAEISGGMKKRVALARTLIRRPQIVLYDEPTTGLDPATSKEISNLMMEMQDKYGISSVIITHDMSCARITSNRVKVIKDGRFQYEGSFDELRSKSDGWIEDFFE